MKDNNLLDKWEFWIGMLIGIVIQLLLSLYLLK